MLMLPPLIFAFGRPTPLHDRALIMTKKISWLILLLLSILLFSCSTVRQETYPADFPPAQCLPSFPDKDGWYGGDGAYSIKLDQERTLWLFGDTFVSSDKGRKDRIGMDVVMGTTLAISTYSANGQFNIHYYLKKKNGKFLSFFGKNEWLWPQDPFMVNNVLYVPLLVISALPEEKTPFNFKVIGHKIARIKNYTLVDPLQWTVDYIDLKEAILPDIEAFAATSVVFQNHVYFYPLYTYSKDAVKFSGNILVRIPIDKINDSARAIEYLTKDGIWQKGLNPTRAKIVLDAGVSELSVRYHTDDKKWIAIYLSTQNNGNQLLYQTADKPEGPWTEPKALIATIPEVDPQSPQYDKNNFCYAGKEHIEFAQKRNLVVTYVCNSLEDFQNKTNFIRRNLFLYRPVVITAIIPQ
jgi:outer membrane biogenesis lipoprotein LolB